MNAVGAGFQVGFLHGRGAEQIDRERLADLQKPFPGNAPELLKPKRCRVLKPFGLGAGTVAVVGEEVELPRHLAESMAAIRKVELLK